MPVVPIVQPMPAAVPAPPVPTFVYPQQPVIVPLSPNDPVQDFYFSYPQGVPILGHRKSYVNQVHGGCPASQLVKDGYGNYYCQPTASLRRLRRELEQNGANLLNQGQSPHAMLFDLLVMLSEL